MALKITGLNRLISPLIKQKWNILSARTIATSNRLFDEEKNEEKIAKDHEFYDIIIVGGGMVGTTLACSLAKNSKLKDKKILLLEGVSKFKGAKKDTYSNRISAINKNAIELMQSIGAWDHIVSVRQKPVLQMQVWDACSDARITFNHDNFSDSIATVVENDLILEGVYKQLEQLESVNILNGSRINRCELITDGASLSTVHLKNGSSYSCDLLVGADGFNSVVRRQMGIENLSVNYHQLGLVANVELAEPGDNNTAWQRFLPTGPVALLPLSDSMSSIVWTTTPEHAKQLIHMDPLKFVDALNEAFYKRYPRNQFVDEIMKNLEALLGTTMGGMGHLPPAIKGVQEKSRAAFPLSLGHAHTYVAQGVCLIGDAAHRVHPLAGQGANLGFGDIDCLTQVLGEAVYNGAKLGSIEHLNKYQKERLIKNIPMMFGIHGLQRLYTTDCSPIVALRSVGLRLTNALPPLKKILMSQALG